MGNWRGHLKTITAHKWRVMKYCFQVGLYRQGLAHDLSKYGPREFLVGAKYYQGNRSPNEAERLATGVSSAWLHHKGRNRHHLEYWIDYSLQPPEENPLPLTGMEMPVKYVVEMFCDRMAASKTYRKELYQDGDPWEYYAKSKSKYLLHPASRELLESLLLMLRDRGEEETFRHIRGQVLKK